MQDWNGSDIEVARSRGGVLAVAHPYNNLVSTGCSPWPPPEILQKLYQSRQERAFHGTDLVTCKTGLGYYCDLQSIHSEDAITWSVFGTVARAPQSILETWVGDLFTQLELSGARATDAEIFLWRRIPHPDNLVPGGPEIDIGISTTNTLLLCEAKWQSGIGTAQGKAKDKDQLQLRGEFLRDYGPRLFPPRTQFAVLGVSLFPNAFCNTVPEGIAFRSRTWEQVCALQSHPLAGELRRYLAWKTANTKIVDRTQSTD